MSEPVLILLIMSCAVLSRSVMSDSLWPMDCSPSGSSMYGVSSSKNTGVGCYVFVRGIFPTQGSNPGLQPCRWILHRLSHQGSPVTLCQSESSLLTHEKTPEFLAFRGEEFNPGPAMRLDRSELLCNKVLLKYKEDRESFWHLHQKGAESTALLVFSWMLYSH